MKMAQYDFYTQALAPKARKRLPSRPQWHIWSGALLGLTALTWWFWPTSPDTPAQTLNEAAPAQAAQAGQAWPFGQGATTTATTPETSPWDRLSKTEEVAEVLGPDPRTRNAAIDPARLALNHPLKARSFLDNVIIQPESRGGYVVESVLPGSLYERAGLKPGDTIYSLDLPDQAPVNENNMIALTSVTVLSFDVVRKGATMRLSTQLNEEVPSHANH
jgi:hypothetical protein